MSDFYAPQKGPSRRIIVVAAAVLLLTVGMGGGWLIFHGSSATTSPGTASAASPTTGATGAAIPPGTQQQGATTSSAGSVTTPGWALPAPGVGGPTTKTADGVPGGYTHDQAGAAKAGLNAVVAAEWMTSALPHPWPALAPIGPPADNSAYATMQKLLSGPPSQYPGSSGLPAPGTKGAAALGVKVVHYFPEGEGGAQVEVLWQSFAPAPTGKAYDVEIRTLMATMIWINNDWRATSIGNPNTLQPPAHVGQTPVGMPVPTPSWYG